MNERDKHGMNEDGNAIALHEDFSRRLNGDVSISYSDDYGYSRDNKMSGNDATIISTHSGSDGIRCLLCTKFICFRLKNPGGGITSSRPDSII